MKNILWSHVVDNILPRMRKQVIANKMAIVVAVIVCFLLINLVDLFRDRETRAFIATLYLVINYVIALAMVTSFIATFKTDPVFASANRSRTRMAKIATAIRLWFCQHYVAISLVLMLSMLIVFQETHHIGYINNLSVAFCYGLLLFHVIRFLNQKFRIDREMVETNNQSAYLLYAAFIALCFISATTVDDRDPYGTYFQLVTLSWLMVFHLVYSWVVGQWKIIQILRNERTQAELMHLKCQINPHFLFNTLNNFYGLAREQAEETPALILRLSDMLRYTIYQGTKERIELQQEINYLNNFIELQRVRFHKSVKINFHQDIDSYAYEISPLMLIILLENAYKHGVEKVSENAAVDIYLTVKKHLLTFNINNNYDPLEASESNGIGLRNLRRRLKLIYPENHQFSIKYSDGICVAQLSITLSNAKALDKTVEINS